MPLLTFTGLCDLVYAGEPIKYACLPSYMHDDLALPPVISGAVIGIQPLIELILMGGVWGIFAGLGIIVAQRLLPGAIATASAIFMSSTAIASALGGLTGGLGVGFLGLPHVFVLPAMYASLATVGIAIMSRSRHAVM